MAERLRYAINNCRSIDMDNYMLSRNVDNAEGSDTDYWPPRVPSPLFLVSNAHFQFNVDILLW